MKSQQFVLSVVLMNFSAVGNAIGLDLSCFLQQDQLQDLETPIRQMKFFLIVIVLFLVPLHLLLLLLFLLFGHLHPLIHQS